MIEAQLHQLIGVKLRSGRHDRVNHRAHARLGLVAELLGREVDPLDERAGVYPLHALVPAFD